MQGVSWSKRELLQWLDKEFGIDVPTVEDCCTGVPYLKVFARLYPDCINLQRVKYHAKTNWDCLHNLRILQNALGNIGIKKEIQIDSLAKRSPQANLEFLQWIKTYYDNKVFGKENCVQPRRSSTTSVRRSNSSAANLKNRDSSSGYLIARNSQSILIERTRKLEQELKDVESELTFFWGKLRKLEQMAQEPNRSELSCQEVLDVLYREASDAE